MAVGLRRCLRGQRVRRMRLSEVIGARGYQLFMYNNISLDKIFAVLILWLEEFCTVGLLFSNDMTLKSVCQWGITWHTE